MDSSDFDVDLDLPDVPLPPDRGGDGEPRRSADAGPPARSGWLVAFILGVFGALELQTILVMFATSDAGGGPTATLAFGLLFLVSVIAWFIGGMLWFASKFDRR